MEPERGWPIILYDIPTPPFIGDIDGEGNLAMVMTDEAGWVYVFDLVGGTATGSGDWTQYLHNVRNTLDWSTPVNGFRSPELDPDLVGLTKGSGVVAVTPNPMREGVDIVLRASGATRMQVGVYDVAGRSVRDLIDADVAAGQHLVSWDGRCEKGSRVSNGVYFVRMRVGSGEEQRKVIVLR